MTSFEKALNTTARESYANIVTVSLDDTSCGKLDAVARYLHISRSSAARILINNGYTLISGITDFVSDQEREIINNGE